MNVIRFSAPEVLEFLGGPQLKIAGRKYRFNKFILKSDYNDIEQVWLNSFTGSIVSIKYVEIDNMFMNCYLDYVDYLIQNYYLVPEDFDEESLMEEYRNHKYIPITVNSLDRLRSYTILTTTQCNARCFYCYQNIDHNKLHMTEETARDVVKYIANTSWQNETIFLGWFGGEPLYNAKVIDIITYGVIATGRSVRSSMISNGYLMNKELAIKAFNEWHVSNIQITLDGTKDVYNKIKRYIYKDDPNPFGTVIQNIHYMLDVGMSVSIRLNCGTHNGEDLCNLVRYLGEEFPNYPNLSVYAHELFDEQNKRTDEQNKKIFENMMIVEDLISNYNFRVDGGDIPGSIKTIHCMVDSGDAVIISPGGELGLCEHYQNSKFYGNINDLNHKDLDVLRNWRVKSQYTEICKDCPIKPACLKLADCPDKNICNIYEKEYHLKRDRENLKYIYDKWQEEQKKNLDNPEKSCSCGTKE